MSSNNLIDFNKYYDSKDVVNYELFIGRDGEYYKVKTRYESAENVTHYKWADEYLKRNNMQNFKDNKEIEKYCKTPLEFLVHYLGFIRYTHSFSSSRTVYLTFPNPLYFNKKITKEQIDSLYKLFIENKDNITTDLIEQMELHREEKNLVVDNYFKNISSRR